MATKKYQPKKFGRKELPSGFRPEDFTYIGRPAVDQGDFGPEVGIVDMVCINQFGAANNAKYYHGGVVQDKNGGWWVYVEWGRMKSAKSWNGSFGGGDFQFWQCFNEDVAREAFAKQMESKNTHRIEQISVAGEMIWAAKTDKNGKAKDGYLVQSLATREKGLPDAYSIKDEKSSIVKPKRKKASNSSSNFQPQVVSFARDLVGGTQTYTRALTQASGVTPTLSAIQRVRDSLIPACLLRIKEVNDRYPPGTSQDRLVVEQCQDKDLQTLSRNIRSLVPQEIPRSGLNSAEMIMSADNINRLRDDLDVFESSLGNEDFSTSETKTTDPDQLLNAQVRWMDPTSEEGRHLWNDIFLRMSNRRHGYIRHDPKILNIFEVTRPDRDAKFLESCRKVASIRQGKFKIKANLQFPRQDLGSDSDLYQKSNTILAIHGTRPVNFGPILGTNFRLPKSLPGAQITGANFGHGIYYATDWRKSSGYTGRGYWGHSGGDVRGRQCLMFLCDMIMGDAYRAPSTGSWSKPPNGLDSVFGVGGDRGHRLENDEHVIFSPDYQRIRYILEFTWPK